MNKLLTITILTLALAAQAATVTGNLVDILGPNTNPRVRFIPQQTPITPGKSIVLDTSRKVTPTNGTFSVNLVGGCYDVDFGRPNKKIRIFVPLNNTNVLAFNDVTRLAANAEMNVIEVPAYLPRTDGIATNLTIVSGNGAGLGNLNGTNIQAGTIPLAALNASTNGAMITGYKNRATDATAYSVIAGGTSNLLSGGANYAFIGGGLGNNLAGLGSAHFGVICGGALNINSSVNGFLGGGGGNSMLGDLSVLVGGIRNSSSALCSTLVGGQGCTIEGGGIFATLVAGQSNLVSGSADFIGGGANNATVGDTGYDVIVGGTGNRHEGQFSMILGGANNFAAADWNAIIGSTNSTTREGAIVIGNRVTNNTPWSVAIGCGSTALTVASNGVTTLAGGLVLATNAPVNWPRTPPSPGAAAFVNSNGTVYILTSLPGRTTWAATNKLAP